MEGKRLLFFGFFFCNCSIPRSTCNAISANCLSDIYIFCAVVLKWRKTKQQKLTCITAPTVRLHMGHLSVSKYSLFTCHDIIGLCLFLSVLTISLFILNQCANAVEATSSQIMDLLEREFQLDLLKREARSLSESYGAVLSQSKSLLKAMYI